MDQARADIGRWVRRGELRLSAADLTFVTCGEVSLSTLDTALVGAGQWFPVDGPGSGELGLMVEGDSTGPLRMGFGGWRDLLLGVQFEDGRGRLVTVGGQVMKNVAGYDLTKFMVGQRGVFGRVVTLCGRTFRRPESALAARMTGSVDVSRLRPSPSWVVETRGGTWAGWLGDAARVDFAAGLLAGHSGVQLIRQDLAADAALRERLWKPPEAPPAGEEIGSVALTVSVPVGKVQGFVLEAKLREWVADPWHGVLLARVARERAESVQRMARELGGRADSPELPVLVSSEEATVLRRLKQAFDPDGTLRALEIVVV